MRKIGLLHKILVAIILGVILGQLLPEAAIRVFLTFNSLFSTLLNFVIPLIILGLIAPGIADLGKGAKRLLLVTLILAYCSTVFSGYFTYLSCNAIFPSLVSYNPVLGTHDAEAGLLAGYFSISAPPVMSVTSALVLAFILGLGMTALPGKALHSVFTDFRTIVEKVIAFVIVPLLPIYIFGIFLNMAYSGAAFQIITLFGKIILVIFALHVILLVALYVIAGIAARRNPFRLLLTMIPAYMTALGTSSSAATIPVTLEQTKKNGVNHDIADFCIPLCATIHMPGSMMKIVAMSMAICLMQGIGFDIGLYTKFIITLTVAMIAAPGVPGGAIMVAVGVLQSVLGFDADAVGLMIALYIAIDSFGTAANVTGDGAIAVTVDTIDRKFFAQHT